MSALDELMKVGGARVIEGAPLGERTTYRVGGSARALILIASRDDVAELGPLMIATGLPLVGLGNGSNLLVEDGEHEMLIVHLGEGFTELAWRDEGERVVVDAGAALDLPVVARRLATGGVVDFEWAVGVPGTVGGAVAMNAGGHGSDVAASLVTATIWRDGEIATRTLAELELGYRTSAIRNGDVVLDATFALVRGDASTSRALLGEIVRWRREHQPGGANGGSVFRNPPGDHAARLIEAAGCKGLRRASAQVSEKHANFIQVERGGRATDVYTLMLEVKERVREDAGVELESEHRFIGFGVTP